MKMRTSSCGHTWSSLRSLPTQSAFSKALEDRKTGLRYACVVRCDFTDNMPNVNNIHPL